MTTVQLEVWQLIALLISFFGAVWLMGSLLLKQIDKRLDERFTTQESLRRAAQEQWDQRFTAIEHESRKREREHLELLADLPREFVRREDHIRFETAIHGKLDALNAKMDLLGERQKQQGNVDGR